MQKKSFKVIIYMHCFSLKGNFDIIKSIATKP